MISKEIENKVINFFMPYDPVRIGLFGSRVRGDNNEDSDLDVLYNINKGISLYDRARMQEELSEIIGIKVHLASDEGIKNELLRSYINKDLKLIYGQG